VKIYHGSVDAKLQEWSASNELCPQRADDFRSSSLVEEPGTPG